MHYHRHSIVAKHVFVFPTGYSRMRKNLGAKYFSLVPTASDHNLLRDIWYRYDIMTVFDHILFHYAC